MVRILPFAYFCLFFLLFQHVTKICAKPLQFRSGWGNRISTGPENVCIKKKKKKPYKLALFMCLTLTPYTFIKKKKPTPYPHPHAFLSSSLHLPTIPQCSPPRREWPSLSHERRKKENIGKMAKKQRKQRRERQIDWFPRGGG